MNNQERKQELAYRVDKLVTKDNHSKKMTCKNCGDTFHGPADARSCSDRCRKALQR